MSRAMMFCMPGRTTFTTTSRPSCRRARCTCAIDGEVIAEEVAARGEQLTEFDEDVSELFECLPNAHAARRQRTAQPVPREKEAHEAHGTEEVGREHDVVETVTEQYRADVQKAQQLARAEHQHAHTSAAADVSNRIFISRFLASRLPRLEAPHARGEAVGVAAQAIDRGGEFVHLLAPRQLPALFLQIVANVAT